MKRIKLRLVIQAMKIEFQFFPDMQLLIQRYLGDFSFDHYPAYMYEMMKDPHWEKVERVLTDIREVNPKEAIANLSKLIKFRDEVVGKKYLNVFLVSAPLATATVHLYQDPLAKKDYDYQYCSTLEYALELLELESTKSEMEPLLENLDHQF